MKFAKKLMSVLLVVLMLVTMALPAMAANGDITITLENVPANHTYAAYQIFKGTLSSGILTDIAWGNDTAGAAFLAYLKDDSESPFAATSSTANPFAGSSTASEVATAISGWPYNEINIRKFADAAAKFFTTEAAEATVASDATTCVLNVTGAGTGYYLIKDITAEPGVAGATDYLLQVVGPTNVAIKSSQPTFSKMVNTTRDGTYTSIIDAEVTDAALANIKDGEGNIIDDKLNELATSNAVWFKLEATLPSLFNYYNQYYLKFIDEVPAGLVPIEGSSKGNIYLEHENGQKTALEALTSITENKEDLVDHDKITSYTISLDLGDFKGWLEEEDITYTLNDKIIIKYAVCVVPDAVLGNGDTPDVYGNKNAAKMIFSADMNEYGSTYKTAEIKGDAHVFSYGVTFTKVDSATKEPLEGAKFVLYRSRSIDGVSKPYYAVVNNAGWITDWTPILESDDPNAIKATVLESNTNGQFVVKGLDSLSYYLKEIAPPAQYEPMKEDVLVTLNHSFDTPTHKLTSISVTIDGTTTNGDVTTGMVTGSINNTKGSTLPATGGMGTTIFYIAGAVLLLGSITAFAVKKRGEN